MHVACMYIAGFCFACKEKKAGCHVQLVDNFAIYYQLKSDESAGYMHLIESG